MSFAGGHGTIAGMGGLLDDRGAGELVAIGSLAFGIASAAATAGLVIWGIARNRHARL